MNESAQLVRVDPGGLAEGQVMTVVAGRRALCLTRTAEGYGELAEISREQLGAGFSVRRPEQLQPALKAALAHADGPSLVEIHSSSRDV